MENKQYIKFYRYIRLTGTTASFLLFLFATLVCFPFAPKSSNLAEAVNSPVESESTIAMVVGKSSASLSLTPSNPTGSFASSSTDELASFDVTTNNYTGYTLNIAASDDNGKLINSTTDTSLDSIDSAISESTFDNTLYNGKWGYNPSKYNSTENTSFRPAPTSDGSTLNVTKCANGAPTTTCPDNQAKDNYTIGLGARADLTTKYGTYSNTFVLTAVGNPVAYTLNYLDNSGDTTVSNLPNAASGNTSAVKVEISSQVPVRTGYTFAGWCDEAPTINADGSSVCSGTSYQPSTASNPTYYSFIDQTMSSSTGSLYATWVTNTYEVTITNSNTTTSTNTLTVPFGGEAQLTVTPNSNYYLSNVSCPTGYTCSGYSTGTSSTGTQTVTIRNDNTTSGGTLGFTGTISAIAFQHATISDCGKNMFDDRGTDAYKSIIYTTAKIGDLCYMTRNLDLPGGTTLTSADSNVTSNYTLPASSTSGFSDDSTAYVYNSGSTSCGNNSPCYSYYSYPAVTAGANPSSGEAISDICPKGWRLPTSAEYTTLKNTYTTGATLTASPFLAVYAGRYYDSSFDGGGSRGYYWSSTANGSNYAYALGFDSSDAGVDYGNKRRGFSVRCVLETRTPYEKLQAGVLSMQDIGNLSSSEKSTLISQMADSTVYHSIDSRDNQVYDVAKLNGQMWMAENLNLTAPTVDLTSSNTNLSTTVSKSTFTSWQKTSGSATLTAGEFIPVSGTDSTSQTPYGTLYNYCAASAGTICTDSNSSNATYDICPKGWRLPTGGSSGEFQALYNNSSYNSNAKMRASISQGGAAFALAGSFYGSTPNNQGSLGFYWSSTRSNDTSMYFLRLYTAYVDPADSISRSNGISIRCVLK